jgi:hypothetical protein
VIILSEEELIKSAHNIANRVAREMVSDWISERLERLESERLERLSKITILQDTDWKFNFEQIKEK